jgi:hypothetical protein
VEPPGPESLADLYFMFKFIVLSAVCNLVLLTVFGALYQV